MTSTSPILAITGSRSSTRRATSCSCSERASTNEQAATSAPQPRATPAKPGPRPPAPAGSEDPAYLAVDNYPGGEGDVYVGDSGGNLVQKFDSSGHLITGWGPAGQKDGSDDTDLPVFGPLVGLAVGGPDGDPTVRRRALITPYDVWSTHAPAYEYKGPYQVRRRHPMAEGRCDRKLLPRRGRRLLRPTGGQRLPRPAGQRRRPQRQYQLGTTLPDHGLRPATRPTSLDGRTRSNGTIRSTTTAADCTRPSAGPVTRSTSSAPAHLSAGRWESASTAPPTPSTSPIDQQRRRCLRRRAAGRHHRTAHRATESTVTLTGHDRPGRRGDIAGCHFEYGFDKTYGTTRALRARSGFEPAGVQFHRADRRHRDHQRPLPGTTDHYRLVATNVAGAIGDGRRPNFITTAAARDRRPGLGEHLTADHRRTHRPGQPERPRNQISLRIRDRRRLRPDGAGSRRHDQRRELRPADRSPPRQACTPHVVYHYRLVATTTTAPPPSRTTPSTSTHPTCPNENVRQQTQANYLPDCRAYELVSPGDAGGTQLFPHGPNTGLRDSPSRFSFTGLFSTIPDSGGKPIDGSGDLYVATRTDRLGHPLRRHGRQTGAGRRRAADGAARTRRPGPIPDALPSMAAPPAGTAAARTASSPTSA